jgi:OOP family OmpA-OmpF porin
VKGWALILAGAVATLLIGAGSVIAHGPPAIAALEARTRAALDAAGGKTITARFVDGSGWLTRHPVLSGGAGLDAATRAQAAAAAAAVPGVGGVSWAGGTSSSAAPLHCQHDVEALLRSRTIRFADASAALDPASREPLDEVAAALRPCSGAVIAVLGHTSAVGGEEANLVLSQARADAVRAGLAARGIDARGLRAKGMGSTVPLAGLAAADPANRRIEFRVIAPASLQPTPVDTPGAGGGAG